MNIQEYTKSINALDTYFSSIGVHGIKHTKFVGKDLQLIAKPDWFSRLLHRIPGLQCSNAGHLPTIIQTITAKKSFFRALDAQTKARAAFVVDVLRAIEAKKDPGLTTLAKINLLSQHIMHSQIAHKDELIALEARLRKRYSKQKAIDPENVLQSTLDRLQNVVSLSWNGLPGDVAGNIFSYLKISDLMSARAACTKWHRAGAKNSVWNSLHLVPENKVALSSLRFAENPYDAFMQSRQVVAKLRQKFPASKLFSLYKPSDYNNNNNLSVDGISNEQFFLYYNYNQSSSTFLVKNGRRLEIPFSDVKVAGEDIFAVRQVPAAGFTLYRVDPETAESTKLYTNPGDLLPHTWEVYNGKLYAVLQDFSLCTVDLVTGLSQQHPAVVGVGDIIGPSHGLFMNYYANAISVIDLEEPAKARLVIDQVTGKVVVTSSAIFAATTAQNIAAYDRATGKRLALYTIGDSVTFMQVQNGLLFVKAERSSCIKVYDVLSGRLVNEHKLKDDFKILGVSDNKIITQNGWSWNPKEYRSFDLL